MADASNCASISPGAACERWCGGIPRDTAKTFLRDRLTVPAGFGDAGDTPDSLPNSIAYFPVMFAAETAHELKLHAEKGATDLDAW
jgi:hypothetical protein